jgi:hypothetical protein
MPAFQNLAITSTMENEVGKHLNAAVEPGKSIRMSASGPAHDFEQQCLRILRCTAHALANSPGGLRFKAGTRPWLDALSERRGDLSMAIQHGG